MVGIADLPGRAVPCSALPAGCQRCWSGQGQGDVVGRAQGPTVTGLLGADRVGGSGGLVDAPTVGAGRAESASPGVMVVFDNAQLVDAVSQGSLVRLGR